MHMGRPLKIRRMLPSTHSSSKLCCQRGWAVPQQASRQDVPQCAQMAQDFLKLCNDRILRDAVMTVIRLGVGERNGR